MLFVSPPPVSPGSYLLSGHWATFSCLDLWHFFWYLGKLLCLYQAAWNAWRINILETTWLGWDTWEACARGLFLDLPGRSMPSCLQLQCACWDTWSVNLPFLSDSPDFRATVPWDHLLNKLFAPEHGKTQSRRNILPFPLLIPSNKDGWCGASQVQTEDPHCWGLLWLDAFCPASTGISVMNFVTPNKATSWGNTLSQPGRWLVITSVWG